MPDPKPIEITEPPLDPDDTDEFIPMLLDLMLNGEDYAAGDGILTSECVE